MAVYYSKDHEWARLEGGICTVGITGYAAAQLGDITFVELPEVQTEVSQGEVLCEVESVKAASEVFAPVSGRVIEVNLALSETPEMLNSSPEDKGWIARLAPSRAGEEDSLFDPAGYQTYLDSLG